MSQLLHNVQDSSHNILTSSPFPGIHFLIVVTTICYRLFVDLEAAFFQSLSSSFFLPKFHIGKYTVNKNLLPSPTYWFESFEQFLFW